MQKGRTDRYLLADPSIVDRFNPIIAVHLTGNPCDLDALRALADKHKLILMEDCAHA